MPDEIFSAGKQTPRIANEVFSAQYFLSELIALILHQPIPLRLKKIFKICHS